VPVLSPSRRPSSSVWRLVLVTWVVLAAVVAAPAAAQAPSPSAAGLDAGAVYDHLVELQAIADAHDGNRSAGTSGYQASVDYTAAQLADAGFTVTFDEFQVDVPVQQSAPTFSADMPAQRTFTPGTDFLIASPPTALEFTGAPLQVVGTSADGVAPGSAAGCVAADWAAFPEGFVALVAPGGCSSWDKVWQGAMGGAGAIVMVGDTTTATRVELMGDLGLPVWSVSQPVGADLQAAVESGLTTVSLDTGWAIETRTDANVVAEKAGTDPDAGVVVLGSHLDSMITGPGINDPGSGVAVLLELADALGRERTDAAVRIGLWGGEELGAIGSQHYAATLTPADRAEIVAYLNFDMIGSPNWYTGVYDPATASDPSSVSPGSDLVTALFEAWFDERGLPTVGVWTEGRSDDGSFAAIGIPTGGLFSGAEGLKTPEQAALFGGTAGEAYDPCYHLSCDSIDNVDMDAVMRHAAAIEGVTRVLAGVDDSPLPVPTPTPTPSPTSPATTPSRPVVPAFTG
jgi:Zn-dependent M28 family amino/carboxypeptidase